MPSNSGERPVEVYSWFPQQCVTPKDTTCVHCGRVSLRPGESSGRGTRASVAAARSVYRILSGLSKSRTVPTVGTLIFTYCFSHEGRMPDLSKLTQQDFFAIALVALILLWSVNRSRPPMF
jgi:hypothetical protein